MSNKIITTKKTSNNTIKEQQTKWYSNIPRCATNNKPTILVSCAVAKCTTQNINLAQTINAFVKMWNEYNLWYS